MNNKECSKKLIDFEIIRWLTFSFYQNFIVDLFDQFISKILAVFTSPQMKEYSSMFITFCRFRDWQSTDQSKHLFELFRVDMFQIGKVHFTMSNNEVSKLFLLFIVIVFKDCLFYGPYDCAERIKVDSNNGMSFKSVEELLSGLGAPSTLLFKEISQTSRHWGWWTEASKQLVHLLFVCILDLHGCDNNN